VAEVLIVDDEEGIREFLSDSLLAEGHAVQTAADGEEALGLLRGHTFAVVMTDLKMPRMDGMSLVRTLSREQPEVQVIVLTAHGGVDSAIEATRLGVLEYLEKPVEGPAQVRLVVARAAERHHLRVVTAARAAADQPPPMSWGAASMKPVEAALRKVAVTKATVLLSGESGTGKEVAAKAVHTWSPRASGPFVAINCAALAENLLESELFGHEKGAFTGANGQRRGKIELAAGGTFFLDEVGELAGPLQAKLLRVLQEQSFERVGGGQTVKADVRWVAATNRDLQAMVQAGQFRDDLYHRLAVFPVAMPPLRERATDIPALAQVLLERVGQSLGAAPLPLSEEARTRLMDAPWPGNVRELANTLERAAILAEGPEIDSAALDLAMIATPPKSVEARTLADVEREAIAAALDRHAGNRRKAAKELAIGERTLYDKLKRYGLS